MRKHFTRSGLAVWLGMGVAQLVLPQLGSASDPETPIDLSAFDTNVQEETAADIAADDLLPVSLTDGTPFFRPYVTGIVGASFGTLKNAGSFDAGNGYAYGTNGSINQAMFTGGGAIGAAIARPSGLLR